MAYIDPTTVSDANMSGKLPGLSVSLAAIVAGLNSAVPSGVALSTTAAVIDITAAVTELTVAGAMTGTLPNGTFVGQRVRIRCVAASASPSYVLTVTTPETLSGFACASTFGFTFAGQEVVFEWASTSKWRAVSVQRAGYLLTTIGTTVLTNLNLYAFYGQSITNTVASTSGGKGMPNGSAVGELMYLGCAAVSGTPVGTITLNAYKLDGTAGTTLTVNGATTPVNTSSWRWDGTLWVPVIMGTGSAVS